MVTEILLVEDNPGDVRLVREAFRTVETDLSFQCVQDGREALDVLSDAASLPDLVILDLNLPRVHGHEVLETIRSDPTLARLPVLVLTSSDASADVQTSYQLGANAYLMKPTSPEAFEALASSIEEFWLNEATLPPALA